MNEMVDLNIKGILPSQSIGRIETCCTIIIAIIDYWQDRDLLLNHYCHHRLLAGQRPVARSLLQSQSIGRIETCCTIIIAIIDYWKDRDQLLNHYCHHRVLAGQRPVAQLVLPLQGIGKIETCCSIIIFAIIESQQVSDLLFDHVSKTIKKL